MSKAIYPGSFDPVTLGHIDIITRASKIFDEIIVGVLRNSSKSPLFSIEERVNMLEEICSSITNVKIMSFDGFSVDFAKEQNANVIIRGLRAITDFEYELQMAQTNRVLNPDIDTLFLTTSIDYSYLSSSIVKEVASLGGDISRFVPEPVIEKVYSRYRNIKGKDM
ncbi:MAG: pantetheine-phosphate adenylyltransferase [Lachnospiraceae bacterium]